MKQEPVGESLLAKIGLGKPSDEKITKFKAQVVVANQLGKLEMDDKFIAYRSHVIEEIKQEQTKILLHHDQIELREEARIRLQVLDQIDEKMKIKIKNGEKASNILTRHKEQ